MHLDVCSLGMAKSLPSVNPFMGESQEIQFDDWLPEFERSAIWIGWSDHGHLLQLAAHLIGRVMQNWDLQNWCDKGSYAEAINSL